MTDWLGIFEKSAERLEKRAEACVDRNAFIEAVMVDNEGQPFEQAEIHPLL